MTLNEIASVIRANISNGLKGVANYQYPSDAIKAEISNVRNSILFKLTAKGKLANPEMFTQKFENIELDFESTIPFGTSYENGDKVPHCKIWKLAMTQDNSAVLQFGPPDLSYNFKIYYTVDEVIAHKYSRVISKRPYVFIDLAHDSDGFHDAWIFNLPEGLKFITDRSIKSDPVRILESDGMWGEDEEFPAPSSVQDDIISTLSERYIRYYRNLNQPTQANDGTEH